MSFFHIVVHGLYLAGPAGVLERDGFVNQLFTFSNKKKCFKIKCTQNILVVDRGSSNLAGASLT